MVYTNRFVMNVVIDGQFQKELADGSVILPYEAEYSLRFRNRHNRRAVVHVDIDGEDISDGGFVIPANGFIDIERPANVKKKFKFVSLDSQDAQDFGKDGPNTDRSKGVIRARFHLEKEYPRYSPPQVVEIHHHHEYPRPRRRDIWYDQPIGGSYSGSMLRGASLNNVQATYSASSKVGETDCFLNASLGDAPEANSRGINFESMGFMGAASASATPKDGCTVEGGYSGQNFVEVHIETETEYTELKIVLRGVEARSTRIKATRVKATPTVAVEVDSSYLITEQTSQLESAQAEVLALELRLAEAKKKKLEAELAALES